MCSPTVVFTLGYQLRSVGEFIDELCAAGVDAVVDVRDTPLSRKQGFSKNALTVALASKGIEYFHARFAGNPRENRHGPITHKECLDRYRDYLDSEPQIIEELDSLFNGYFATAGRVCLICYERHPDDCHRSILLDRWCERMAPPVVIQHLGTEGAPRFIRQ